MIYSQRIWTLAIDPVNTQIIYAGAYKNDNLRGAIYKSTDGGNTWSVADNGLPQSDVIVLAVDPENPSIIFAGTYNDGLFKSTNGAQSWSPMNNGLTNMRISAIAIDPNNSQIIYVGTSGGGVFKSVDGGSTWNPANNGLDNLYVGLHALIIDNSSSSTLYVGTNNGIFKSTDAGATWTAINNGVTNTSIQSLALNPKNSSILYAGTNRGILKSVDSGIQWQEKNSGLRAVTVDALAINPQSSSIIFAGSSGGIHKSVDKALSWTSTPVTDAAVDCFSFDPFNPSRIFAGSSRRGVYLSEDGGLSWRQINTGLSGYGLIVHGLAIDPTNSSIVYAATSGGVFKSIDGGNNWSGIATGSQFENTFSIALDKTNPSIIYVATYGNGIFKSVNGGASWQEANNGLTDKYVNTLAIHPTNGSIIYAGTQGSTSSAQDIIFKSTDGGASWSPSNNGLPKQNNTVYNLSIDPSNPNRLYAATFQGVFMSSDGGQNWSELNTGLIFKPVHTIAIDPFDSSRIYAGTRGQGVAIMELSSVGSAPTIISHPQSQTILPGQSVTLSVQAAGTAPLSYQWYQGTSGDTSNPISGATSSSYTTPSLNTTTSYWVKVSNAYGSANSNTATITVSSALALTVTSPNGGESWVIGSLNNITWTSSGSISNVKIEYSTNGGSSWLTIIASTPNTGSYSWKIPGTPSTNCLVRISEATSGTPSDTSDATFSIIANAPGWIPKEGLQYNMIVYGTAYNNNIPASEGDWIGAFGPGGDNDCRAVAQIGANGFYYLTVRSDASSQENITFKLWPLPNGPALNSAETIEFVSDKVYASLSLHFGLSTQNINLVAGWNWISFNVVPNNLSLSSVFAGIINYVEQVKTQTKSAIRVGGNWMGDLPDMSDISRGAMFKIKISQPGALTLSGQQVAFNTPINLNVNWNWVAYLPTYTLPLQNAIASIISKIEQVKSQTQSVIKVGENLIGDLTQMVPGLGYTIKMSTSGTLVYPGSTGLSNLTKSGQSIKKTQVPPWTPITGNEYNMIAYGKVYKDNQLINTSGYYLGSFGPGGVNDCRSVSEIGVDGSYYATIRGNINGEIISFKVYESSSGNIYDVKETLVFSSDSLIENFSLHFDTVKPVISLYPKNLRFAAIVGGHKTSSQKFVISNSGGGTLNWSLMEGATWVKCSRISGTGNAEIEVSIEPSGLSVGTYTATITVSSTNATNSPQLVNVFLSVIGEGASAMPFGFVDTPVDGASGIEGAIPVTGWALDDIEVTKVEIKRDPHPSDNPVVIGPDGLVYIGDAVFVEGARPDVEQAYPTYPLSYRAGWGYMLLTNFLPNQGNGTYRIHAIAYDKEGHRVTLGTKTIHCDNAHATYPFGTIDTPAQGGQASGSSYVNFAWALTPQPKYIPTDGSTILVWIDGVPQPGHPSYNHYRSDIATLFPGYANTNGAVGYYYIDTTKLVNGVHTIAWSVVDSAGVAAGIGSRYFTVLNTGAGGLGQVDLSQIKLNEGSSWLVESGQVTSWPFMLKQGKVLRRLSDLEGIAVDLSPIYVRSGYNLEAMSEPAFADSEGWFQVKMGQADRVEVILDSEAKERLLKEGISLGKSLDSRSSVSSGVLGREDSVSLSYERSGQWHGYLVVGEELRPLPIGSYLDSERGIF
ncbi:MAG: hypothetical protein ABIL14_07785, partial [candidate division WOR-3 bacterium]